MVTKEELLIEITNVLGKCTPESLESILELNRILVGLSAAQMEYLIELSNLLFCQPLK